MLKNDYIYLFPSRGNGKFKLQPQLTRRIFITFFFAIQFGIMVTGAGVNSGPGCIIHTAWG